MRAFQLSNEQISRVAMGLAADELGRAFGRHVDFLTVAGWRADAVLGPEDIGLNTRERAACAQRAAEFFGVEDGALDTGADATFLDWGTVLGAQAAKSLRQFRFGTSGVDGMAKICAQAADETFQDGQAIASLLHGRRRVMSLVSPHGLMGFLTTVLAPNLQGVESLDARASAPEELAAGLQFGDVVVATPTLWRYLATTVERMPDNVMGVAFGEPMTPDLMADLKRVGLGAFREFYGSTEHGAIGWRDSPSEPFVLFDHWRGGAEEHLVRIRPDGAVRPVDPMDALDWRSDRAFVLNGRRDGAVQVGGVNVHPERIAALIAEHKDVQACSVRLTHRNGGVGRLVADIVLAPGVEIDEAVARRIDVWCRKKLRPQERPRIYNVTGRV